MTNDGVSHQTDYQSYLLRLWRAGEQGPWRASLENVQTGERRGFADLEALFAFLEKELTLNAKLQTTNSQAHTAYSSPPTSDF